MARVSIISLLVVFCCFGTAAFASDELRSIAQQGGAAAKSGIGSMNAQEQLGVSASGNLGNGGRNANVEYSQVLSGNFVCPNTAGDAGRYSKLQQFVTVCETTSSTRKEFWVCIPNDPNDAMSKECENGTWHSASIDVGAGSWTSVLSGLSAQIESCTDDRCGFKVKRSADFSGGEGEAASAGQNALANASGTGDTIKRQGAYLPDGTVLQAGSNANSGTIAGEMVAAGTAGLCIDDVKASIDNGTPVFTCDGEKEVETFSDSGEGCVDEEVCLNEETETILSSKTCTVSLSFDQAFCTKTIPKKICRLTNSIESHTCSVESSIQHIAAFPRISANSPIYDITNPGGHSRYTASIPAGFRTNNIVITIGRQNTSDLKFNRNLTGYTTFSLYARASCCNYYDLVDIYVGTPSNPRAMRLYTRKFPYDGNKILFSINPSGFLEHGFYFVQNNKYIYQAQTGYYKYIDLYQSYKNMGYKLMPASYPSYTYNIIKEVSIDTCEVYRNAQ